LPSDAVTYEYELVLSLGCSEKVIILLSDGLSTESLATIKQTIVTGSQLAGKVSILAFGLNTRGTVNKSL